MNENLNNKNIILNPAAWDQYNTSLERCSNFSSNILLNDIWRKKYDSLHDSEGQILDSIDSLLNNADNRPMKNWKTSLSKIDPVALLDQTLPSCTNCTETKHLSGIQELQKNDCQCNLGIADIKTNGNRRLNALFGRTDNGPGSSFEEQLEDRQFRPKFGRSRSAIKNYQTVTSINEQDTEKEFSQEQDEDKTHKSNVAKIAFKSAREHLIATNPAARRTLGASRKAQSKFVSPLIGAQSEKEATSQIEVTDERLKHLDPKMIELIESEIIDKGTKISWDDIAGLQLAKSVIQEAVVWPLLRPDIFTGLRRPPKGILLFGPPGTGKTLIGKCVAAQCNATFFSISASSLTSKWIGDGEKMVRALFAVARCHQPAVIFIDEIDSLLTQRSDSEHEATRRIKTEFLVQFDGAATGEEDRLLIVGATNRPQELDEAARRRLVKRLYIPLPDADAREQIISNLLQHEQHCLSGAQAAQVARLTEGYSGADMKSLCSEAAMGPIRSVPLSQIVTIDSNKVRPVCLQDFINALQRVKPSVSQDDLGQYIKWNNTYGQGF